MKVLVFAVGVAAATLAIAAPSACVPDTAFNYNNLGYPTDLSGPGCTLGAGPNQLTLVGFSWFTKSPTVAHPEFIHFDDTDVFITPEISGGGKFLGLDFAPNPNTLGSLFVVPAGKVMSGTLQYIIDPPPPIIDGFGMSLDPSGPSQMQIKLEVGQKEGSQTTPVHLTTLVSPLIQQASGDLNYTFPSFGDGSTCCNYIDVRIDFSIGSTSTTSDVTSGGGTATIITTQSVLTPEPAACGLVGIGLVAIGVLRRRFKNS